jgi:DNA-binding SARP family transcriptional activator/TolB-like protein
VSRDPAVAVLEPAPRQTLSLSILGEASAALAGREIAIKSRKSRAILGYLSLCEKHRETRERLAGLFWSEVEEEKARGSLRQTLRELRDSFAEAGFDGFRTEKLVVEFDRASLDVDLWEVIHDAEAGRVHRLLLDRLHLVESLLSGFDDLDSSFRAWLLAKRQTLHERLLRALERGLRDPEVERETRSSFAEAILNLEPSHEEACRHLMRARTEAGDVTGALRAYRLLWDHLDSEYDMEPSSETQELVADIKTGAIEPAVRGVPAPQPPARAPGGLPIEEPKSRPPRPPARIELWVGAFEMEGIDPDKAHLVTGFRRQLIACLVRFREWSVADGSPERRNDLPPAAGGRYAIEVTAYQHGPTLHVVLMLKEMGANLYIWSDRFELGLQSWFEAQRRIVRQLTAALNVELSVDRLASIVRRPEVALDIYDRWLLGQSMIASFSPTTRRKAAEIFSTIIREAADFSPAYSSLAQIYNADHIALPGIYRSRGKELEALELARTAVQLDPLDSRAHLCLGWALLMAKHYAQAEGPIRVACELNENDAWTLTSSALNMAFCGDFDRSRELATQAFELSVSPSRAQWGYRATLCFLWEDYQGCVEAVAWSGDVPTGITGWAAAALFHLGRRDEAASEAQRFLVRTRDNWCGGPSPSEATIMQWFLHLYPISRRSDWERLRDGLRGAGLSVGGMDHEAW